MAIDPAVEKRGDELQISRRDPDLMIENLPEGIKQLIAIARAEVRNRDILLMDAPVAEGKVEYPGIDADWDSGTVALNQGCYTGDCPVLPLPA